MPSEKNMGPIDISILIVNWNTRELVCECLRSVYEHASHLAFEVIVVDNASHDGSCECIEEQFGQVKIIRSHENLGFAKGNNLAARHACGAYLLLLNPDTVSRPSSIKTLLEYAEARCDGGAWGGVCDLPDGTVDPGCRQLEPSLHQRFQDLFGYAARRVTHLDRSAAFEGNVPILSGAYMMVRAEVWQEVHGFDESFTLYAEETDLCYRIREAGYGIYMTGKSRILHNTGSGDPFDPKRMLHKTRGVMQFYRKHYTLLQATCAAVLIWLHSLERIVGSVIMTPWLGRARCQCLRKRMSLILRHPTWWWYGWQNQQLEG